MMVHFLSAAVFHWRYFTRSSESNGAAISIVLCLQFSQIFCFVIWFIPTSCDRGDIIPLIEAATPSLHVFSMHVVLVSAQLLLWNCVTVSSP